MSTDQSFDRDEAILVYRKVIALRDTETSPVSCQVLKDVAADLRRYWETRNGEDSLHEAAFGIPLQVN